MRLLLLDESLPKPFSRLLPDHAVLILRARTNRVADLAPLVPRLLEVLSSLRSGQCLVIE